MNDVERELRELFRGKATGAPLSLAPTVGVIRRARRRQARWVIGMTVVVAALATLSVATLRALDADGGGPAGRETRVPEGPKEIERVVLAEGTDPLAGPWRYDVVVYEGQGPSLELTLADGSGGGGDFQAISPGAVFSGWGITGPSGPEGTFAGLEARVTQSADRVVVELDDGRTFATTLVPIPERFAGPLSAALAFLPSSVVNDRLEIEGDLVAYDASGIELGRESLTNEEPAGPTPEIDAVWRALRKARDRLPDGLEFGTVTDLTPALATGLVDGIVFNDAARVVPGEISIRGVEADRFVLVGATRDEVFCLGVRIDEGGGGNFKYGNDDAAGWSDCAGGWPTSLGSQASPGAGEGSGRIAVANASNAVTVTAQDLSFDVDGIAVTAGSSVSLTLVARDDVPYNLAIYPDNAWTTALYTGEIITGRRTTYRIPSLEPGSYRFRCDIHPSTMTGVFEVRATP
jgi:plastocyanin